jgi:predicted Rossmann fold flavoprotein
VDARVWATCGGEATSETTGDVLFTDYGLSGPAVMSQSRAIAGLLQKADVKIHIDMFPDMTEEQLAAAVARTPKTGSDALVGLLPSGLIPVVLRLAGQSIAHTLKNLTLTVAKLRPYKEAQVTAGGVASDEVDPATLQSRLVPGLFFAGEVLDVDGDSGGYNLQWAWASGYVAGLAASSGAADAAE